MGIWVTVQGLNQVHAAIDLKYYLETKYPDFIELEETKEKRSGEDEPRNH